MLILVLRLTRVMYIHRNTFITPDVSQDGRSTLNPLFSLRFLSVVQIHNELYFKPILVTQIENQRGESSQPATPKGVYNYCPQHLQIIIWVEGSLIY